MPFGLDGLFAGLLVIAKWSGNFVQTNPWPAVAIFIFSIIVFVPWARFRIKDLLNSLGIKKLKVSGTEFEFGREDKLAVQKSLDESFDIIAQYRKKIENNINRLIRKTGLNNAFADAAGCIFSEFFGNKFGEHGVRATLHMQDFVFEDRLYQILNYYPQSKGAHRHFSLRRGIIGRVWRSQIPASAGFLTQKVADGSTGDKKALIPLICLEWGLNHSEALDFLESPSYCCIPIQYEHRLVGLFFMDCKKDNFGWDGSVDVKVRLKALETKCKDEIEKKGIHKMLGFIDSEMADFSPRRSLDGK
jgi:hypothetical protein